MNAPLLHVVAPDERAGPAISSPARSPRRARRRRRGQRDDDKTTHTHSADRWMVSYADFITLLFAFFVVMYATSSINEPRYRTVSGALATAFSPADASPIVPSPPAKPVVAKTPAPPSPAVQPAKNNPVKVEPPVDAAERAEIVRTAERVQHMQALASRVDEHLQTLVQDGKVQVTRGARGIAIEINAAVLFDPAKADLKPASHEALRSLAAMLGQFVEPLQIEGHSDDLPIATREFRSNWELSAARAASVGRFLIDQGVAPGRVGIAGYAEFRPLTANADGSTRARNRRVTIVVLSADDTRPKEGPAGDEAAVH